MKKNEQISKTYILKYDVYNSISFEQGTIVKVIDPDWEFEVVEGELKGERGNIADGLNGWLLEDTTKNRKLFANFKSEIRKLQDALKSENKKWDELPAAVLPLKFEM